jgi:hypothetical protein
MKTEPSRFTTAAGPAAVSTTASPPPGAFTAAFAGRSTRGSLESTG